MSNLATFSRRFEELARHLCDFKQTKEVENEVIAGLYQDVVLDRLSKLGFEKSKVRFKLTKKKFLWIFETDKVLVFTELLTDDVITAMKIIG